jgi:queuine tRNA-ribosyltransferase
VSAPREALDASPRGDGFEVVRTHAGEQSILDRQTGEVMHPVGRSESDSLYVLPSRLADRLASPHPTPLVLLDVGLGAASNAGAALRVAERLSAPARELAIVSIDHSLEPLALALAPEHAEAFGLTGSVGEAARHLLARPAETVHTTHASWTLLLSHLPSALAAQSADSVDIVFWDVYSPRSLPELWSEASFRALRRVCRAGATVHTYSGALGVRAAMLLGGFAVGLGPSSGGKQRHTTIASSDLRDLERPLGRDWLARLRAARSALPEALSDRELQQLEALPQFS